MTNVPQLNFFKVQDLSISHYVGLEYWPVMDNVGATLETSCRQTLTITCDTVVDDSAVYCAVSIHFVELN